jgi:hypothetical protein
VLWNPSLVQSALEHLRRQLACLLKWRTAGSYVFPDVAHGYTEVCRHQRNGRSSVGDRSASQCSGSTELLKN